MTSPAVTRDARIPWRTPGSLAGYFSGRHLPPATRPEVLTAIVTACGGSPEDVADWLSRLSALHAGRRRTVAQQPPYRGLVGFGVNDGSLLFGRDGLSRQLTQLVDDCAASGGGIVLVVGPSGTGKSSLLRAGLIPSLLGRDEEAPWTFAMVLPGGDLAETLREAVEDSPPDGRRHLLIIDQMEEAFTLSPDEGELGVLVRHVAHWAAHGTPASPRVAVLSLRADHYGEAAGYPELLEAMRDRQLLVPPMTTEELRSVIEGPAEQVRLKLEWGLADVILADLRAGDLPHALPHLSHTLQRAGHAVIGVDSSPVMLARARQGGRLSAGVVAEAHRSGLAADGFGAVVAVNLLHVVEDPAAVVDEAVRLCEPGGRVVLVWPTDEVGQGRLSRAESDLGWSRGRRARAAAARVAVALPGLLLRVRRHSTAGLRAAVRDVAVRHGLSLVLEEVFAGCQHLCVLDLACPVWRRDGAGETAVDRQTRRSVPAETARPRVRCGVGPPDRASGAGLRPPDDASGGGLG